MDITEELGQKVIQEVTKYTDVDINIMNLEGIIVSSTDKNRINTTHLGAIQVIETGMDVTLDDYNIDDYPGTKKGVNLPIMHQNTIKGVVGVSGRPKEVTKVSGLIRASVEIVLEQIYLQRQARFHERQWNSWLQKLLHPQGFQKEELEKEAVYTLNVHPGKYWRVLVLIGTHVQKEIETIRQELKKQSINSLFVLPFLTEEVIIAIPSSFKRIEFLVKYLKRRLFHELKIGVGDLEYGVSGIRLSYFQAKQALTFAENSETIAFSEQWELKRLLVSIAAEEYTSICTKYEKRLSTLGEEYLTTLDVYFNNSFSIKETASILHIHRNTLFYRLEQIKRKTKLDPRQFEDAMLLKIIRERQG